MVVLPLATLLTKSNGLDLTHPILRKSAPAPYFGVSRILSIYITTYISQFFIHYT